METRKITSHEIALDFSEMFQKYYPAHPLISMMEDLRKEIESYADQEVSLATAALQKRVEELEKILSKATKLITEASPIWKSDCEKWQIWYELQSEYYKITNMINNPC